MCDRDVDEAVLHVMLVYNKNQYQKTKMVFLPEMRCEVSVFVESPEISREGV